MVPVTAAERRKKNVQKLRIRQKFIHTIQIYRNDFGLFTFLFAVCIDDVSLCKIGGTFLHPYLDYIYYMSLD